MGDAAGLEHEAISRGREAENFRKSDWNPRMDVLKRGLAGKIAKRPGKDNQ